MIDPIQSLAPPASAVASRSDAPVAAVAQVGPDAGDGQGAPPQPAPRRDPVSLSVDRDATGVFVYTLTDSASGRVLAVIPRSAVAPQGWGEPGVDITA